MAKKIKVGIIFGGRSGEHEVSLVSATSVIKALDKSKYEVIPIGITKEGRWLASDRSLEILKEGNPKSDNFALIPAEPVHNQLIEIKEGGGGTSSVKASLDVVFPVLHGTFGEDGTVQGLLELANIPYVGCGVLASAVGMDKAIQKALFKEAGLPLVDYIALSQYEWKKDSIELTNKILSQFKFPFFIKPANMGSSVGVSKVHDQKELKPAIERAFQYDQKILIEEGIDKARELECAVLGNEEPKASVVGEIVPSNEFYDYEAKYVDGKSKSLIPAPISEKIQSKIQELSLKAFRTVNGEGMARVDFFMDNKTGKICLNEVNTIPGFTSISMYPKMWEASGVAYPKLLDELIQFAIERHQKKNSLSRSYKPKEDWYKKP